VIIGISGKKRSGKDTIYGLVKKRVGHFVARAAFGDQIKEEVASATGVALDHIEENKERFRPMLQWWGADFRRHYKGESYWLDKMLRKMRSVADPEVLVITDVRYPNEADLVKEAGGIMLRVDRETGLNDAHSSENLLDSFCGFDYRLENNGTLEDLEAKVAQIVANHCCAATDSEAAFGSATVIGLK
tara:strand:- start:633 stop:1196 length:564 start_codon:yes stop_codon:yes gene_type:complete